MRFGKPASTALMLAAFTAGVHVSAGPPATRTRAALAPAIALSLGAPNDGRLLAGSHLEPSSVIRVIPAFANADFRWGLPALVRLLERVALRVSQKHPGSIMSVGDISRRAGGGIREHLSHQSGRDADIGFYVSDPAGAQLLQPRFIDFDANGTSREVPAARFDDARNWALVEALVTDREAKVEFIFVSVPLRSRLIREALRQHAPASVRMRAAGVMRDPAPSTSHTDHFHVRITCPRDQQRACEPHPRKRSGSLPSQRQAPARRH